MVFCIFHGDINMSKYFKNETSYKKYIFLYFLISIFYFILIELIHRPNIESLKNFLTSTNPLTIFYLTLFFTFSSVYVFIFKKPIILCNIHYIFWCILAFISNISSFFKSTPLIFEDIFLFKEATDIASKYINKTVIINIFLIIICITLILAFTIKNFYNIDVKLFNTKNKFLNLLCYILFLTSFLIIKINLFNYGKSLTYTVSDFNITDTYNKNGFFYSFYRSTDIFFSNNINSNYNMNKVIEIKNKLKEYNSSNEYPEDNIILIQLESIFDPLKLKNVNFSQDPLKNYRQLCRNNKNGEIIVPVIGGGTIQTEFEILTGISMEKLYTKMPYLNLLNHNSVESIAHIFKDYGYSTTSIHNYFSTFYNRVRAYESLGFDTFIPLETISNRDRSENFWYKDNLIIDEIKNKILSTPEKDFIFGVTVEAHGPYNTQINGDITVESSVLTEKERIELQNYVNIIKHVDEFIINLINSLNDLNESYILIFYSDHLPTLGENHSTFNKTLSKEDLFKTPYLIITSDKSKNIEFNDENLHSYEFLSEILNSLNLNTTIYQKFRNIFKNHENFNEYEKQLLLDIKHNNVYENNVFPHKMNKIKIGNNSPIITDIKTEDNITYVFGDNFTPNSKVVVNKKIINSEYVSKTCLKVKDYIPKPKDIFISVTFSNKNSPLNSSNFFEFLN